MPVEAVRTYTETQTFLSSKRTLFLDQVRKSNEQGVWTKDIDLLTFIDLFPQIPVSITVEGFFYLKREQWAREHGNAINFVAQVAESLIIASDKTRDFYIKKKDEFDEIVFQTTVENALALAVEQPLSQALKTEQRRFFWEKHDGEWDLRSGSHLLRRVHEYAVLSSQSFDFETARFLADQENHLKFIQGRSQGDTLYYFEPSPSPKITPSAIKRGYLGNDCIFIKYTDEKTGEEVSDQYWFKTTRVDFINLFRQIGISLPENATDVDIMQNAQFIDSQQFAKILGFIEKNRGNITSNKAEIENFANFNLKNKLTRQLRPVLETAATKLISGQHIAKELEAIIGVLSVCQNDLKEKISHLTGMQTPYFYIPKWQREQLDMDPYLMAAFVKEKNMPLVGCGTNTSSLFGDHDILDKFKLNDPLNPESNNFKDDPNLCKCSGKEPHFHCPGTKEDGSVCGEAIVVGEGITQCPTCKKGKTC